MRITKMEWELKLIAYVQKDGLLLADIPIDRRTYAVCLTAVMQTGLALQYVPVHIYELEKVAIEQNPSAIQYVKGGPADVIINIHPKVIVVPQ